MRLLEVVVEGHKVEAIFNGHRGSETIRGGLRGSQGIEAVFKGHKVFSRITKQRSCY